MVGSQLHADAGLATSLPDGAGAHPDVGRGRHPGGHGVRIAGGVGAPRAGLAEVVPVHAVGADREAPARVDGGVVVAVVVVVPTCDDTFFFVVC